MPRKPKRPCNHPGCRELVDNGYCDKHKKIRTKRNDAKRGTSTQRGYGVGHRKIRAIVMKEEPLCRHCKAKGIRTPGTEMDHIDGNPHNIDRDNLQMLCKSCHSKKTIKEQGGFGK